MSHYKLLGYRSSASSTSSLRILLTTHCIPATINLCSLNKLRCLPQGLWICYCTCNVLPPYLSYGKLLVIEAKSKCYIFRKEMCVSTTSFTDISFTYHSLKLFIYGLFIVYLPITSSTHPRKEGTLSVFFT